MPVRKIEHLSGALQAASIEDARAQTRASECGDEDALLSALISAATQTASDRLQRALVPARYRLTLDAFEPVILLSMPPILSVESVIYIDPDGRPQTLSPSDYLVDAVSEPGRLLPAPGQSWPATQDRVNAVEVTYSAGYSGGNVPFPIKQWILLAVGDMYENRSRSAEKPIVPQNFADGLLDSYRIFSL